MSEKMQKDKISDIVLILSFGELHHWKYFLSSIFKIYNAILYALMNFKLVLENYFLKMFKTFECWWFQFFEGNKILKK